MNPIVAILDNYENEAQKEEEGHPVNCPKGSRICFVNNVLTRDDRTLAHDTKAVRLGGKYHDAGGDYVWVQTVQDGEYYLVPFSTEVEVLSRPGEHHPSQLKLGFTTN